MSTIITKPQEINLALSIHEASAATGLTVHTLRYYERIGLLTSVNRAANGHRRYSSADINRIKILNKLRQTGMPLDKIRRYAELLSDGEGNFPERHALLSTHRAEVLRQIAELQDMLALIDYKLTLYDESPKRETTSIEG